MIELENLLFGYNKPLLEESLSLKVDFPAVVSVLGNNGVGKSTFFSAVFSGNHLLDGQVKLNGSNRSFLNSAGIVYQGQSYSFGIGMVVQDFISALSSQLIDSKVFDFLIDNLQISQLLSKSILEISQGQLQRCLVAQTLLQDASVYLLDEPESYLDIKYKNVLASVIKQYVREFNKIVFLATHDLNLVNQVSTHFINFSSNNVECKEYDSGVLKSIEQSLLI